MAWTLDEGVSFLGAHVTALTSTACAAELKEAAEAARAQQQAEKQRRKQAELRLSSLEEELQDLKTEKESLGRVRSPDL